MSGVEDDPERRFRMLPYVLRRWNPGLVRRRLRASAKQHRYERAMARVAADFEKSTAPRTEGPVLVAGNFQGGYGITRAAAYELSRLSEEHREITVLDLGLPNDEARATTDGPPFSRVYLFCQPDHFPRALVRLPAERVRDAWRIGLWVWETPLFPRIWRYGCRVVHEIWTPSGYCRQAIMRGAGDIPVSVRPHNVTPATDITPIDRARLGIPPDAFLGVAIMDLGHCPARKNPWAHIAAWQAAFGDDPARRLVMKVRYGRRLRCVRSELRSMARASGNVHFIEHELSPAEIAGLQSGADVYLSLHRAEGYGLNIHECLAYGTPVVATDYSANAEYGPRFPNYHPVPYRLVPYRDWTSYYPDNDFEWAEARIGAAAEILRGIAANRATGRADT